MSVELEEGGNVFARQVARGVYVEGTRLELERHFSAECIGVIDCGAAGTCADGVCVPAWEATEPRQPTGALEVEATDIRMPAEQWTPVPGADLTIIPDTGAEHSGWLILASGRVASTRASSNAGASLRLVINGREVGLGGAFHTGEDPSLGPFQAFIFLEDPQVEQRAAVEVQSQAGTEALVSDVHLVAIPIQTAAEPQYVELEQAVQQPYVDVLPRPEGEEFNVPHQELLQLRATSAAPEPLLLMGTVSGTEAPGLKDLHLNWEINGEPLNRAMQFPRSPWTSAFFARVVVVDAGTTSVRLLAAGSIGDGSRVAHARLLVMRADAFAATHDFRSPLNDVQVSAGDSVATELGALTTDITPSARDYLVIQTANFSSREDCPVAVDFQVDTEWVTFDHQVDTSSLIRTFGRVDLLTTAAQVPVRIQARSTATCDTRPRWSSTVLLRL